LFWIQFSVILGYRHEEQTHLKSSPKFCCRACKTTKKSEQNRSASGF
jgi:hypothetical protein